MTISTSACTALMRLPSSVNAVVRLSFHFGAMVAQLRTIIGPWLEAKTPASSAMFGLCFRRARADAAQEVVLGHAGHVEVEAQQVGVHELREISHIIAFDRGPHLRFQGVAVEHPRAVRAVLLGRRRALQVEEQLGERVVAHPSILPQSALMPAWRMSVLHLVIS